MAARRIPLPSFLRPLARSTIRRGEEWYYRIFHHRPREHLVRWNDITGPYRLYMRLADGPGARRFLRGNEQPQRGIFLPLLRRGWVCVDVGAHVGDYTVEMALLVGPSGRVVAYEPSCHWFAFLQRSIAANRLTNVETRLAVVGASSGVVGIPAAWAAGSLTKPVGVEGRDMTTVDIPMVRLDDELERVDAMKVDCEGYEVEVLRGMERLVRTNPDLLVLLEVHDGKLQEVGSSLTELATLLLDEYRFDITPIGRRYCICSRGDPRLDALPKLASTPEFVENFRARSVRSPASVPAEA